jgi:hypothetical protein
MRSFRKIKTTLKNKIALMLERVYFPDTSGYISSDARREQISDRNYV